MYLSVAFSSSVFLFFFFIFLTDRFLLWQVFAVCLHAAQRVYLSASFLFFFVFVRTGAKSIVHNLLLWSAADINSHFFPLCVCVLLTQCFAAYV